VQSESVYIIGYRQSLEQIICSNYVGWICYGFVVQLEPVGLEFERTTETDVRQSSGNVFAQLVSSHAATRLINLVYYV